MENNIDLVALATDPDTPLARLAELAYQQPRLRPLVAANPSAYPGLLEWLAGLNDPAVDAALRGRAQAGGVFTRAANPRTTPESLAQPRALSQRKTVGLLAAIGTVSLLFAVTAAWSASALVGSVRADFAQPIELRPSASSLASGGVTPTPSETPAAAAPVPAPPPAASAFAPQDPAAFPASFGVNGVDFDSPSGNIHCGIYAEYFGCAIDKHTWTDPNPTGKALECAQIVRYGGGFIARPGKPVEVLCRGGVMFGGEDAPVAVLPYATSVTYGGVVCESAETGVTCRNLATGAGFQLSRSRYSMF